MPGRKSTGSTHVTVCPECQDELITGFDAPIAPVGGNVPLPVLGVPLKQRRATGRQPEILEGPITCTCGNVTARFDIGTGVTHVLWRREEPVVGNFGFNKVE